ncbi:MAG: protein phosphatase 2C domain-containing protein [Gemmataceae bacterium]|nr:protein phosphatase 2C domain-containing protein [Gemmataceae bacterium]
MNSDTAMPGDTAQFPAPPPPSIQVEFGALSDAGKVRPNNEDHFLIARYGRSLEPVLTNLPQDASLGRHKEIGYGMVVADGMGGAAAGEVASQVAIQVLWDLVLHTPDWIMSTEETETQRVLERMAERYRQIDAVLTELSSTDPTMAGMGTTLTLACSLRNRLILAHVGDSRAYFFRGGKLHQLTRDHTVGQSLVKLGMFEPDDPSIRRLRHALTRVLGGHGGSAEAEVQSVALCDGDQVLLCSDGLTDMVDDDAIAAVLGSATTAQLACQMLVDLALGNGGRDNVTAVLARYRFTHNTSPTR